MRPLRWIRGQRSSAVEQLFRKQQVLGSNPSVGSRIPVLRANPAFAIRRLCVGRLMSNALINGVTMHYEDSGSGPAVFMTHGYAAAGAMWQPQRKPLNEAGYRLVSWDM